MTRTYKKLTTLFLALLLVPVFSGCSSDSEDHSEQANRCLDALSAVQSADSLYAKVEIDWPQQDEDGVSEIASEEEYWKDSEDILYYTAYPGDEAGGKLWYLCYDGTWYTQFTYEEPAVKTSETDTHGYDWTEADTEPANIAFWEGISQTAEELIFVSEDHTDDGNSILTFQAVLSDSDKQLENDIQLDELQYVFTLDADGNLLELEARYNTTDNSEEDAIAISFVNHAVFRNAGDCRTLIDAEMQKIRADD